METIAPRRSCSRPGCPSLAEVGERYCLQHKREKYRDDNRKSYRERGYTSSWDKLKAMKKRRDALCERCHRQGIVKPVEIVHHIVAIEDGGELLNMDNLMSVCRVCHGKLHSKK